MTRYAIILATEDYKHFPRTPFCHADARLLETTLVEHCDFAKQHVLVRLLSLTETVLPSDTLDEIENLVKGASRGDTVLFYYAGHGHLDGNDTFLVLPHSAPGSLQQTALPLRDVSERLRAADRVNVRIFDACHSGIESRDSATAPDARGFSRAIIEEAQQGWITLASCSEDESSYPDPATNNGIFTRALCDAILTMAPGPIAPETLKLQVVDRVAKRTQQLGYKQTPVLNAFVRGNVTIAERRSPTHASSAKTPPIAELAQRAAKLRSFPTLGGAEHKDRLKQYMDGLHAHLEASKDSWTLGLRSSVSTPAAVDESPYEFRETLVRELSGLGQANHTLEQGSDEIMERADGVMAFMQPPKGTGRYRTVYRVSQPKDWPESWCTLALTGDGYIPSFLAGFYILPFQYKAMLACVVASRGKFRSSESSWNVEKVTKQMFTLDAVTTDAIAKLTRTGLEAFAEVCAIETDGRLSRLENELIPAKGARQ